VYWSRYGYSVFCRQDFVGIDYGLLDCATYDPLPDYYGGVLWSRLMGTGVSRVSVSDPSSIGNASTIRAYGHCHATSSADMTVLLLNLAPDSGRTAVRSVTIDLAGGRAFAAAEEEASAGAGEAAVMTTEEYHLTAGPSPTQVRLNGKLLQATEEGGLPSMVGSVGSAAAVRLAPASIVFVVLKGAGVTRCHAPVRH
jgi:heparanase 1